MVDRDFRTGVLRAHGARGSQVEELLAYTAHAFDVSESDRTREYPLPDEESVAAWEGYARDAESEGLFERLRRDLVQLRFPIAAGTSETAQYRAATRKGELPADSDLPAGLRLEEPDGLRLIIHPTPAGRVPALVASSRGDFEALMRALTRRNEPASVPAAVGATMVAGYNNWGRVRENRKAWESQNPLGQWATHGFREMIPDKHRYQDRYILLSSGRYSDVAASCLDLEDAEWLEKSITIRLEHECAHYFTRRVFGVMTNALHDELVADFMGIVAAEGRYRADWFLRFMGLEEFPRYRDSGRLGTYRGDPELSDGAFAALQSLMMSAATNLEAADRERHRALDVSAKALVLCILCGLTLEEIASAEGGERLKRLFAEVR